MSFGFFGLFGRDKVDREITKEIDARIIEREIQSHLASQKLKEMLDGEKYYAGAHDILKRKRQIIGENGKLKDVENLPNHRLIDDTYTKMVDQKNNYLLGRPFSIVSKNEQYVELLKEIFNRNFHKTLKAVGEDSLNCGIGYMFVNYDEKGKLKFKRLKPYEVIPIWKDSEHTELEFAIRLYKVLKTDGNTERYIYKVELYAKDGIYYYEYENRLIKDPKKPFEHYITSIDSKGNENGYYWEKIPLITFKLNNKEIPLIKKIKPLQDALNLMMSNFANVMSEDIRNSIMVLVNYNGENLAEFRKNLATYGAVKVGSASGTAGGDLKTLQVEVNSDNYEKVIEIFRKAIIDNARGYDINELRSNNSPNQMNIQSIFANIDIDANGIEVEYQASFEKLIWYVNCYLTNAGFGDFEHEKAEIIFNRDMLMCESEIIDSLNKSAGMLSKRTLIAQHPLVKDVEEELKQLKKEREEELKEGLDNYGFDTLNTKEEDDKVKEK